MNSPGATRPRSGWLPAHERLGGDDVAAGEAGDRLVLDRELAARDRLLELLLEPVAAQDRGVHAALEARPAALALLLGLVHGDVGVADQLARAGRLGVVGGDADAGADADRLVAGRHALGERGEDPLGDHHDVLGPVEAVEQDGELVAAEARDGVARAHARAQALGDRDQQLVADRVAERVVDGLEVVDVDEQDGDGRIGLARAPRRRGR